MMNEEIKGIFGDEITVDGASVPVAHLHYRGKSKTFVVWTMLGNKPTLSGDDEPLYSVASVDIDVYSDGNYLKVMAEIKRIMIENEWLWVEDSAEMYEDDTGLYHITLTFEKERNI